MNFKKLVHAALLTAALPIAAFGQGVPTIDVTSIARLQEMITEAKAQLREQITQNLKLDDQTLKLIEQIGLMKNQLAALQDGLSLADLGLDPKSFLAEILPQFSDLTKSVTAARSGDWTQVLAGGSLGGSSVSSHVEKSFAAAGLDKARVDELAKSDQTSAARIGTAANMSAFMSVAAESSSQASRESLGRINDLVQIETTNLKEAIDLNTRVTAELGIALANIWAMEAVQTVGLGEAGIMDAATAAEEEKYLTVNLED